MDIYVIASGTTLQLVHPFWTLDWDNLGMPPLHRLSERGPLQHGDTDLGYRLDPRFPTIVIGALASTPSQLWDLRAQLISLFRPGAAVTLKFVLDNGDVRQLDTVYYDGMSMPSRDRLGRRLQKTGVILKAGDPTFYSPTAGAITFALGGGGDGGFEVPMEVPHQVGASSLSSSGSITYEGTWLSYPHIVRITGPVTDARITNNTTSEKLDFTGATIGAADYYDIDLRFGYKTVVDAAGANQIGKLTGDSDLATFHLAPHPEASGGINSISISGTGVNADTRVQINYFVRYLGI